MMKGSSSRSARTSEPPGGLRRRSFLACAFLRLGGLGLAAAGCTLPVRAVRVRDARRARIPLLEYPELSRPDGRLKVVTERLGAYFVCRSAGEDEYYALSATCTHQGCTVDTSGRGFHCPCHGSRYDPRGRNVAGPARRPLPRIRAWREGDAVLVDFTSRLAGEEG